MSREPVVAFIVAACAARDRDHTSGTLEDAESIRATHPEVATASVHTAAILGDEASVRRFIAADPAAATAKGGPHGWDALTHLCFSRYLRLDRTRSSGFVGTAAALLDAGADPDTGWWEPDHEPHPEWESVLYGAAGVAHHAGLTRLLLERGANPNDGEVTYHAPETHEMDVLRALVESGRVDADGLASLLQRKSDWHHEEALRYLLEHGADPNRRAHWGNNVLHNAVLSANSVAILDLLLDHGADPRLPAVRADRMQTGHGLSAVVMAARTGRGDALEIFARRGHAIDLPGVDGLIAACARGDAGAARAIADREPALGTELQAMGDRLLAAFAGTGNVAGTRLLLDLGVAVAARFAPGDPYFSIARDSTALHVAAWRAAHGVVRLLLERKADPNARDGAGRTPLQLAVRAGVDSWWTQLRAPDSVAALLDAGAALEDVPYPCGYAEVDALLRRRAKEVS